jgi:dTDP-glucose pyrophosphorylase
MKYKNHLIPSNLQLLEALKRLEKIHIKCLIVVENGLVLGTITDGDIRRSLLKGYSLSAKASSVMNIDYTYIEYCDANGIYYLPKLASKLVPIVGKNKELDHIVLVSYKGYISFADAVIMAGGKGTRLYPLTKSTPKPLVHVDESKDLRIIDLPLRLLEKYGFQKVFIIVNHMGDQVERKYQKSDYSFEFRFLKETEFKGTFGSVYDFKDYFTSDFFMMNCDVYTTLNIYKMYSEFKDSNSYITVAGRTIEHYIDFGVLHSQKDSIKVVEKPTYRYDINMGIYWINRSILSEKILPRNSELWHITDEINRLTDRSMKVSRFEHVGSWVDIGRVKDLEIIKSTIE